MQEDRSPERILPLTPHVHPSTYYLPLDIYEASRLRDPVFIMSASTALSYPQPRLEGLPGICISLWRRLSTTAKATAGNAIQLDERGLLHVKPDAFGRTFVTELVRFFPDKTSLRFDS